MAFLFNGDTDEEKASGDLDWVDILYVVIGSLNDSRQHFFLARPESVTGLPVGCVDVHKGKFDSL